MGAKRVVLRPLAAQDIENAMRDYQQEGGVALSLRWAQAVARALRHVGQHAGTGSPRYAGLLNSPGLRFWSIKPIPYLVFYRELEADVDVWRVLHAASDIPQWLGNDGEKSRG